MAPWKVREMETERETFVRRLLAGEPMTALCREYGISRKTGYKFKKRFMLEGELGLQDKRRVPGKIPHRTPKEVEQLIVEAKESHKYWGPKKLRPWLMQQHPGVHIPSVTTIHDVLKRYGLVAVRKRRHRSEPYKGPLRKANGPNEVWAADFKGQFRLGNGRLCYPLTITDVYSRALLACEALESTCVAGALGVFMRVFKEFGLPEVIRTDNGTPFASTGVRGLSKLGVRFLALGIIHERIERGHPEQNGQHERMHRTLKEEATRPAGENQLQQQEKFDRFVKYYNEERPHEAIGMKCPWELYRPSDKPLPAEVPEGDYALDDFSVRVHEGGSIYVPGEGRFYVGAALGGYKVGVRETPEGEWIVRLYTMELGKLNLETRRIESE